MSKNNKNNGEKKVYNNESRQLKQKLKESQKEINRLKAELRTLQSAWDKSEKQLKSFSQQYTLDELIDSANTGELPKDLFKCDECGKNIVKRMVYKKFILTSCVCGFVKKVNI